MYFHLHCNSKKLPFYNVKILKCESFLIALRRNFKKSIFLWRKNKKNIATLPMLNLGYPSICNP